MSSSVLLALNVGGFWASSFLHFMLLSLKVLFRIHQTHVTRRRRRNIQYVVNPLFEEDIIDEEVYENLKPVA